MRPCKKERSVDKENRETRQVEFSTLKPPVKEGEMTLEEEAYYKEQEEWHHRDQSVLVQELQWELNNLVRLQA